VNQVATVVKGRTLTSRGRSVLLISSVFRSTPSRTFCVLLAATHENDAFHGVVVVLVFVLKAENTQTRGVADLHMTDVADADWRAVIAGHDDFANVVGGLYESKTAHVIKLARPGNKNRHQCWRCCFAEQ